MAAYRELALHLAFTLTARLEISPHQSVQGPLSPMAAEGSLYDCIMNN